MPLTCVFVLGMVRKRWPLLPHKLDETDDARMESHFSDYQIFEALRNRRLRACEEFAHMHTYVKKDTHLASSDYDACVSQSCISRKRLGWDDTRAVQGAAEDCRQVVRGGEFHFMEQ